MYNAIITRLTNVRPHPNADRVKLATCHGNQVVIGLDHTEDELGIYFPTDGQLSDAYCRANNLYRTAELNSDTTQSGMFDDNRRVRTQRFRGQVSDGFWMPLSSLSFIKSKHSFQEGYEFSAIGNTEICSKYVNKATLKIAQQLQGKKVKNAKTSLMFKEHFDTAHFGTNISKFEKDQTIIITEKLHGTSGRIGHVEIERKLSLVEKIAKLFGAKIAETEWSFLNGSRRTVLEEKKHDVAFHDPSIREKAYLKFKDNLRKGETVYFEIVGYESTGTMIMPSIGIEKIKDSDLAKNLKLQYGDTMKYTYGCVPNNCEVYVYRMTMTNTDGQTIDYCWDDVVRRCQEIGVKHVPFVEKISMNEIRLKIAIDNGLRPDEVDDRDVKEEFTKRIVMLGNGPSFLDSTHIKEGVCVRIEGGLNNQTFKYKNDIFKMLEGILKDSGAVDIEEAESEISKEISEISTENEN